MALNKPTFKVNIAANKKSTERKTIFADIKPDTSMRFRCAPPVTEDGMLFTKVTNHFRLKNEEGYGLALACLEEHGDENTGNVCYLCALCNMLKNGDKAEQKIADDLRASPRWYLQAWIFDKASETYDGPKLIGLSKTTAETMVDLLVMQDEAGDDHFYSVDAGQDLVITRRGSGLNSKYTVQATGKKMPLSDVCPNWEGKIMHNVLVAIDQKLADPDGQKRAVYRTFEDQLDWEAIQEQIG